MGLILEARSPFSYLGSDAWASRHSPANSSLGAGV